MVREAKRAVQHSGHLHVADERMVAERELDALVARAARADAPARVGPRQRLAEARARRELDRVDDLHVAGAAAEVAEQRMLDLLAGRLRMLLQQRLRLHHDPRRAVAALRRAGRDEALGPAAARLLGEAFLRHDGLALDARRLLRARDDCFPVDDHGARAARAFRRAAVLHRAEAEPLAQHLEQTFVLSQLDRDRIAVEGELHRDSFCSVTPWPRARATAAPCAARRR